MAEVSIKLSSDEALVLFELLQRWNTHEQIDSRLEEGEQFALWALASSLEKVLEQPFDKNYRNLVAEARSRLHGAEEP